MIGYCRRLFEHLKHKTGANDISLVFEDSDKINFNHSTRTITIGWTYLENITTNGFIEYKSVWKIWENHNYFYMVGKQAVWACLLHEFAHYLQSDKKHSKDFKHQLNILIQWFQFYEVEDL